MKGGLLTDRVDSLLGVGALCICLEWYGWLPGEHTVDQHQDKSYKLYSSVWMFFNSHHILFQTLNCYIMSFPKKPKQKLATTAYEVKNNCCLFERLFRAFSFLAYLFLFRRYSRFCIIQMRKMMTSSVVPLKQHNIQLLRNIHVTLEIFKQCSSNLAPAMYITKETQWHLLCCCHGNTLGSSLWKTK